MKPVRFVMALAAFFWTFCLMAQTNTPIPLNRHYFEISSTDSLNHQYNKIVSFTPDSVKIERIFTLENKLIRIQRTAPKNPEYQEYTLEQFNHKGELIEKTTINQANSKYLTTYFQDGQQVGQVMYRGESKYRVFRNSNSEPKELLYNDFEPNPIESKKVFSSHISEKARFYPSEFPIYAQVIWIALLVDESGEVTQMEWANPLGCEERFVQRYFKAIKSWKHGFSPALDHLGNPKSEWRFFHFHFGSPRSNP